jgi:B3/4 domain
LPTLSIAELTDRFPDFRVALIIAENMRVGESRSAPLPGEIEAIEAECRRLWTGVELSAIPGVAAWRAAYKGFGIKKTSYRSSVERLIKRVVAGGALPEVNALVDLYNAASLQTGLCLGCDDLDAIEGARLRLFEARRHVRRHGRGSRRGPQRSAQAGRSRLRRFAPCVVPALELAAGRAHRRLDADAPRGAHGPVERGRRGREGCGAGCRSDRARMSGPMPRGCRGSRAGDCGVLTRDRLLGQDDAEGVADLPQLEFDHGRNSPSSKKSDIVWR